MTKSQTCFFVYGLTIAAGVGFFLLGLYLSAPLLSLPAELQAREYKQ